MNPFGSGLFRPLVLVFIDGRLCRSLCASFTAKKLKIEYPGAIYHVMSRGNGKAAVLRNEVDRRCFGQTLAEACAKNRLAGPCLLPHENAFSSGGRNPAR